MPFGTLTYNGYQFGELSTTRVSLTPVYDDAQRTVTKIRHLFTVSSVVVAEDTDVDANDHFQRVKEALLVPGKRFEIKDKGFGDDLLVNDPVGGLRDVDFGPKPRMVRWDPIGHETSIEFVWELEVNLPPECVSFENFTGIQAFNYSINWAIGLSGFTTRTVSGYLEIAMTRNGVNIPDTADAFRDQIIVDKIDNFHRVQSFDLSADKKRLSFTITDTEIESGNHWPEHP